MSKTRNAQRATRNAHERPRFARSLIAIVFGGLLLLGAGTAQAQTFTDFATACSGQTSGTTVTIGPFVTGISAWSVTPSGPTANVAPGPWLNPATVTPAQPAGASWISPTNPSNTNNTDYTYTLGESLTVAASTIVPATIAVTGWYAADDRMTAISVDGQSVAVSGSYATLSSIATNAPALGSLFQTGDNTLAFVLHNDSAPTGFYGNVSISASCAPPNLTANITGPATLDAGTGTPGDYDLIVTNNGGAANTDGTTTIQLPAGLTLVSVPAGCTATAPNGMTCSVANIAGSGGQMTIPFQAKATGATAAGSEITGSVNNVTGEADTTLTPLPVSAVAPNLVDSLQGPAHVTAGTSNAYTLTVTNTGNGNSDGGTTTVTLPPGLTLVPSSVPSYCTANTAYTAMTCTLPDIAVNNNTKIPFDVTSTGAATGGEITGSLTGVPGEADVPATNLAQADAVAPDLVSTLNGPTDLAVGVPTNFTVDITNQGSAPSTDGTVTINLPPGLTLDPGSLPGYCTPIAGNTGMTCKPLPTINPGDDLQIPFTVTANQSANGGEITGSVTGVTGEPDTTLAALALQSYVLAPAPMLGQWALILLGLLMMGGAVLAMRRNPAAR